MCPKSIPHRFQITANMDIDTRESGRKVLAVVRLVEILEIVGSRSLGATICCFLHVRTCAPLSDAVAFVKGWHALCEISSTSRSSNWRAYMHASSVRPTIELYVSWLVPVAFRRRRAKRQPTGHRELTARDITMPSCDAACRL